MELCLHFEELVKLEFVFPILTGIAIADSSLLEKGVQDKEVLIGGRLGQSLDILGGFIELLEYEFML